MLHNRSVVVVSGGTACNSILEAFETADRVTFALPVSDDGGSSSEIRRVLGGPSMGDIRSRLVRLIPYRGEYDTSSLAYVRSLLLHRLPRDYEGARIEWLDIVEGTHRLWEGVTPDRREAVRAFFVHVEHELMHHATKRFNYAGASVGNLFLTGVWLFTGSIQAAIHMFSCLFQVSDKWTVLPVVNSPDPITIAAELHNGEYVVGQNDISHPSHSASAGPSASGRLSPVRVKLGGSIRMRRPPRHMFSLDEDDLTPIASIDDMRKSRMNLADLVVSKTETPPLPSPVKRILYVDPTGLEVYPRVNRAFTNRLAVADILVYACGSFYTSIIPCLALRDVGAFIRNVRLKVLILNGIPDRETHNMTALDYIYAIQHTLNGAYGSTTGSSPPSAYITHVIYNVRGSVSVDPHAIYALGIIPVPVNAGSTNYHAADIEQALAQCTSTDRRI